MIDVSIAIDAEAIGMSLIRPTEGSYDEGGNYVPAMEASTTIRGAIFPISGSDLRDLEEGIRTEATAVLWSRKLLLEGDIIETSTGKFRIIKVYNRGKEGGYNKAVLGGIK